MESVTHNIDPSGDVVLTLKNANAPFAVWPTSDPGLTEPKPPLNQDGSDGCDTDQDAVAKDMSEPDETKEPPEISMRLSSKHLILASDYFSKMLQGPWKETVNKDGQAFRLTAEDWSEEALVIVMNMIHGRSRGVPRSITLELVSQVAAIVDYYQCRECIEIYFDFWSVDLFQNWTAPKNINRTAILWLHVSWVFRANAAFQSLTSMIEMQATEPVPSLDLPIQKVLEEIEKLRCKSAEVTIAHIQEYIEFLSKAKLEYSSAEHACMNLGALIRHAVAHGLYPAPKPPFHGISLGHLAQLDADLQELSLYKPPPKKSRLATLAKQVSKKAYKDGFQAGVSHGRYDSLSERREMGDRDALDRYNSESFKYDIEYFSIPAEDATKVIVKPSAFAEIRNMISELKSGFDLEDFDPKSTDAHEEDGDRKEQSESESGSTPLRYRWIKEFAERRKIDIGWA